MARFSDLPIELIEEIATAVARLPPEASGGGISFRNPVTGRLFTASKDPLLALSKTSRACRLACLKHLPQLVVFRSLQDLHNLRTRESARTSVAPFIRHLVLDFSLPLRDPNNVKLAMSILCQVPGLVTLPKLAGLSLSSRFLSSFFAHVNHQRLTKEWREVAEQMGNWQGSLLAGLANLSSLLSRGGQGFERFGDVEILFVTGDWDASLDAAFQSHDPPPIPVLGRDGMRLLITTFPPSTPSAPAVAHPVMLASHYIATQLINPTSSYTATPLRPYDPAERAVHADVLKPFDEERNAKARRNWFYDDMATQTVARAFIEKICFQPVEPQIVDALLGL